MYPKYFVNYNTLYLPKANGEQNDVLDRASHFGPIYGLMTVNEDVYLQFAHMQSLLAFCFFQEDRLPEGAALIFSKVERTDD